MTATTRSRARRLGVKSLMVGMAAAAFAGLAAGAAHAGDAVTSTSDISERAGYEYSVVAFSQTLKPFESVNIPSTSGCQYGALENKEYSPGRIVPRGIEVIEPGGVGVMISKAYSSYNGTLNTGIDSEAGKSTATNWDPFNSRDLSIVLHCTTDPDKMSWS